MVDVDDVVVIEPFLVVLVKSHKAKSEVELYVNLL